MDAPTVIIKPDDSYGDIQNTEDNDRSTTSLTSVGIENAFNANQTAVKSEPENLSNFVQFRFSSSDVLSSTSTPGVPVLDTSQSHENTTPSLSSAVQRSPSLCQETCIVENICSSRKGLELVKKKRLRDSVVDYDKYESLLIKGKIANRISRKYRLRAQIRKLTKSTLELQRGKLLSQKCRYCFTRLSSFKSLFRHENSHKVVKQVTCGACGINFPRCNYKKEMEQIPIVIVGDKTDQILKKDDDAKRVSLKNSSSSGNNGNENNSGSDDSFECLVCDEVFVDIKKRAFHHQTHKSPFRCKKCNREYKHLGLLQNHAKLAHVKKDFVETFYSYNKKGIRTLGSGYKFVCAMCDMAFSERKLRTRHHLTHKRPYCCKICSRPYKRRSVLYTHIRKVHIIKNKTSGSEETGTLNNSDDFFCAMCDETFIDKSSRRAHHATHNPPFCCKVCGKKYSTKTILYTHFKNSHPLMGKNKVIYYCSMCDVFSVDQTTGKAHHLTHMSPFRCKRCRKEYKSRNNVHIHFTRKHYTEGEDFFVLGSK